MNTDADFASNGIEPYGKKAEVIKMAEPKHGVEPVPEINNLEAELAAYGNMQQELEEKYMGKWVLFYQGKLVSVYASFDDAANEAVARFGRGPYLIRQVGAPAITLPASVMFRLVYA